MFFNKKKENKDNNSYLVKISALLIHAAKIDEKYTEQEEQIIKKTLLELGAKENELELAILRPFHIFGEGESEYRFWPSLKNAALSGQDFPMTMGEQIRDFTPVEFAADVFIDYATNKNISKGRPIIKNLGTAKPQSLKNFAKSEWKKFGGKGILLFGKIPYRENEIMRYVPML